MDITHYSMEYFSLKGTNAIVTGGNGGIGKALSLALAKAGANIFIPSYEEDDGTIQRLVELEGVKFRFMQVDITEHGVPEDIVNRCMDELGSIDILVNCASICKNNDVQNFGRDDWNSMVDINLNAAFEMSFEVAKKMVLQRSGKIINICSLFSYLGGVGSPANAATKHALVGLTKAYCNELGKHNIQVNGIAPGYFETNYTMDIRNNPETNKKVIEHIPAGRWGKPLDLMGAIIFLASRASDYVNGHILVIDGGYLVR